MPPANQGPTAVVRCKGHVVQHSAPVSMAGLLHGRASCCPTIHCMVVLPPLLLAGLPVPLCMRVMVVVVVPAAMYMHTITHPQLLPLLPVHRALPQDHHVQGDGA